MSKLALTILLLSLAPPVLAFDHTHAQWTKLLQQYLDAKGWVNYARWQKSQGPLNSYLKELQSVRRKTYQSWTTNQKKAFLANAYNAFTVKLILDNYPVKSIKKIGGLFTKPWSIEFFSLLEGDLKSLDPIEHEYLRKKKDLKDPRIHAAVNCASISCPALYKEAFQATKLDAQLDESVRNWLADRSRNRFPSKSEVEISKIFDWFESDFGGEKGVVRFLKKYGPKAAQALGQDVDIDYLDYDWNLNKQ